MNKLISIVLIIMLPICLLDMPYGYYQLIRVVTFVGLSFIVYNDRKRPVNIFTLIFVIGIILFNPFFKIHLGKELWQFVDIGLAILLIGYLVIKSKKAITNK